MSRNSLKSALILTLLFSALTLNLPVQAYKLCSLSSDVDLVGSIYINGELVPNAGTYRSTESQLTIEYVTTNEGSTDAGSFSDWCYLKEQGMSSAILDKLVLRSTLGAGESVRYTYEAIGLQNGKTYYAIFKTDKNDDVSESNEDNNYVVYIKVEEEGEENFDFSLSTSDSSKSLYAGETASYEVTVSLLGSSSENVQLSVSDLPPYSSFSLSQSSGYPTFTSTLEISTTKGSTPKGTYTVKIEGSGGGKTHYITVELNVEEEGEIVPDVFEKTLSKAEGHPSGANIESGVVIFRRVGESYRLRVHVDFEGTFNLGSTWLLYTCYYEVVICKKGGWFWFWDSSEPTRFKVTPQLTDYYSLDLTLPDLDEDLPSAIGESGEYYVKVRVVCEMPILWFFTPFKTDWSISQPVQIDLG